MGAGADRLRCGGTGKPVWHLMQYWILLVVTKLMSCRDARRDERSARAGWRSNGGSYEAWARRQRKRNLDSQEVADEERVLHLAGFGHHPAIVHGHLLRVPSVVVGIVVVVRLLRWSRRRRCRSASAGPTIEARPRVSRPLHPQSILNAT